LDGDVNKMSEIEIETLKNRMDGVEKRFDKVDTSLEKMWSKIDEQKTSNCNSYFVRSTK
jgi:chaperonin cofactor prefoldin